MKFFFTVVGLTSAQAPPALPTTYSVTMRQSAPGIGNGQKIVTMSQGNAWRHGTEIDQYGSIGSVWSMHRCDQGKTYTFTSATECKTGNVRKGFDCPCPGTPSKYQMGGTCSSFDITLGYLPLCSFISSGSCPIPGGASKTCDVYGFSLKGSGFKFGFASGTSIPVFADLTLSSLGVTYTIAATFTDFNTNMSKCTPSGIPCYDMHVPSACGGGPAPSPTPTPPGPDLCAPCITGACAACRACVSSKTGACAACWSIDPKLGTACLYDDGHGCQKCWSKPPSPGPTPTPPVPPTPPKPCTHASESCESDHTSCCAGLKCEHKSGKHVCTNTTSYAEGLETALTKFHGDIFETYRVDFRTSRPMELILLL